MSRDIWNPWHGCRKYSEGCDNCYMFYQDQERGKCGSDIYKVKTNFNLPLKKDRQGNFKIESGARIRVCMTSDFFLEEADPWRDEVWDMIRIRADVHFWLLTKRAERMEGCLPWDWLDGWEMCRLMSLLKIKSGRMNEFLFCCISLRSIRVLWSPLLSEKLTWNNTWPAVRLSM